MVLILSILILVSMTLQLINVVLLLVHLWDFGKIKAELRALIHTDGFSSFFKYWLGKRSHDKRQIKRSRGIVNRFKRRLASLIKKVNGRFEDYSVFLTIRQVLLH